MILAILAESALRSLLLGGVVWIGLNLLRVQCRRPVLTGAVADVLQRRVELAAGNR